MTAQNADHGAAVSVPFLNALGTFAGAVMMAKGAYTAQNMVKENKGDAKFLKEKINTCLFYVTHILPKLKSYEVTIEAGAQSVINSNF